MINPDLAVYKCDRGRFCIPIDFIPLPYLIIDKSGVIIFANKEWKKLTGYSSSEIIGTSLFSYMIGTSKSLAAKKLNGLKVSDESTSYDFVCRHKKKSKPLILEFTCIPEKNDKKRIFIHCTIRDVSEIIDREKRLVLFSDIIDNIKDVIIITDSEANILFVNPSVEKLYGYKPSTLVGKNIRILKSGKHNLSFYRNMWKTILNGETWEGDITNRRRNGGLVANRSTIIPVFANGKIQYFLSIKTDVSDLKTVEAELAKKVKELEVFKDISVSKVLHTKSIEDENLKLRKKIARLEAKLRK